MRATTYSEDRLSDCAEFWWQFYRERPYVVRPGGYGHPNTPTVGPETFTGQIGMALTFGVRIVLRAAKRPRVSAIPVRSQKR